MALRSKDESRLRAEEMHFLSAVKTRPPQKLRHRKELGGESIMQKYHKPYIHWAPQEMLAGVVRPEQAQPSPRRRRRRRRKRKGKRRRRRRRRSRSRRGEEGSGAGDT
jgi:hypothetical protein